MSSTPPAAEPARPLQGSRAAQLLSSELGDAVVRREEGYGEKTVVLH